MHGVELCALGELQVSNQFLHLVHHVIINLFALVVFQVFWLAVVNAEQVVAEGRDHEELLHHAIHVADAAQIAQADVLLVALRLDLRNVAPRLRLLDGRDERRQLLIQERLHQGRAILDQLVQQLVGSLTALVVRRGGLFLVATGALLLAEHDCIGVGVLHLGLVVGGEQEFFEDLPDQVLLLDDSIADGLVRLGDDFASQRD